MAAYLPSENSAQKDKYGVNPRQAINEILKAMLCSGSQQRNG